MFFQDVSFSFSDPRYLKYSLAYDVLVQMNLGRGYSAITLKFYLKKWNSNYITA